MATLHDTINYQARLQRDFPNLRIDSVKVIGEGWDHTAIEANGVIIFRIPRGIYGDGQSSSTVVYETAVLRQLHAHFPVAIPDPQYIAPNNAYFGYPKLSGELVIDLLQSFSAEDNIRLREDWVTIAHAIHSGVSADQALAVGVPIFNPKQSLDSASRIYSTLHLDRGIKTFVETVLRQAGQIDLAREPLTFIHNDLHFLNLLANPENKRITGIIDWSDVHVAPLAREFSIWEWTHDGSLDAVADQYTAKTGVKVNISQARLWRHLEELSDYAEQIDARDHEGAIRSMEHIKNGLTRGNGGSMYNASIARYRQEKV